MTLAYWKDCKPCCWTPLHSGTAGSLHFMLSCRLVMCACTQNLKEGMGTVIEKLMSENVELTERFNEAVRGCPQCVVLQLS